VPVVGGGEGPKILTHFRNQTKQPPIVDKHNKHIQTQIKTKTKANPFMQINQK
jgi:hypothetical protein